jgi:NDP-sugar pyrophosphorylase family protein
MSTRLHGVSGGAPKPLTPIGGEPVLKRNLRWLASHGITETFINLHYRGAEIKAAIGDGSGLGIHASYSEEVSLLGTAGAAKKLERELSGGPFLIVYGDNVFNFDLSHMVAEHFSQRPPRSGTIAIFDPKTHPHTGIAGGGPVVDGSGRITAFREGSGQPLQFVNAACYVLEEDVLQFVPPLPQPSDWARDVFPALLNAGKHLYAHVIDGYCLGIDTPEAYRRAEEILRLSGIGGSVQANPHAGENQPKHNDRK